MKICSHRRQLVDTSVWIVVKLARALQENNLGVATLYVVRSKDIILIERV